MQAKVTAMGLLAQLFRHKNSPPGERTPAPETDAPAGTGEVRGVGAVAVAAGVKTAHGMPAEFSLSLGEILAHVPEQCVWPGAHDPARVLRIPAADVAPGLVRGKAQISLARLEAFAPEVFRWERGGPEAPQVRLPIQKLLNQIRPGDAAMALVESEHISAEQVPPATVPAPEIPAPAVKLQPPAAPEAVPQISVVAAEQSANPQELRPPKDVAISTTLRAVVLGGIASAESANGPASSGHILAPRIAPTATAAPVPVILRPSVLPSANDGGVSLAPRTTPDFPALQNLFMTAATLDLGGAAALAAALPGVRACVISGTCGSAVAGDFSHGVSAEEVRAASADLARIGGATMDVLHRGESDIALFLHGEACVAALVATGGFVPGVHERLARMAELLAGTPSAR